MQDAALLWGSWARKLWNALFLRPGLEKQSQMSMSIGEFNHIYGSLVACGDDWIDLCMTFATQLETLGVHASTLYIMDAEGRSFTKIDPTGKDEGAFLSLDNTLVDGSEISIEWVFNNQEPLLVPAQQDETNLIAHCLIVPIKKTDCVIGVVSLEHSTLLELVSQDFLGKLDMLVAMFGYLLPDDLLRPLCSSLGSIQRRLGLEEVLQAALELIWTMFPVICVQFALIGNEERVAAQFGLQEGEKGALRFSSGQEAFFLVNNTAAFRMLSSSGMSLFDCRQDAADLIDIQSIGESCPGARTVLALILRCTDYLSYPEESMYESDSVQTTFGVIYLVGPRKGIFNSCKRDIELCCKLLSWKLQERFQSDLEKQKEDAIQEAGRIARDSAMPIGGDVSLGRFGEFRIQLLEALERHRMNMRQGDNTKLLQIKYYIGDGNYALVFHGQWQGVDAAIKVYVQTEDPNAILKLATEVVLITAVTHPNIVKTYHWLENLSYEEILALASSENVGENRPKANTSVEPQNLTSSQMSEKLKEKWQSLPLEKTHWNILVMEHCDRLTLDIELRKKESAFILPNQDHKMRIANMPVIIHTACEIAYAMRHLHNQNIVHGDLKPANILLQSDNSSVGFTVKVSDFGTSRILHTGHSLGHMPGTRAYMPPEILLSGALSVKLDVYSYGVILWEMCSRRKPYANIAHKTDFKYQVNKGVRPKFDMVCREDFQMLAQKCWATKVDERPTFDTIAQELERMGQH